MAAMKELYTTGDIKASPEKVWSIWIDQARYPEWNPFLPKIIGDVHKGKVWEKVFFMKMFGKRIYGWLPMKVVRLVKNEELSWAGNVPWLLGIWSYGFHCFRLEKINDNETRFSHRFLYFGPIMTVPLTIFPFMRRNVLECQQEMIDKLKQLAEA